MEFAEMEWKFARNAKKFELKDIEAALNEIQVDLYSLLQRRREEKQIYI